MKNRRLKHKGIFFLVILFLLMSTFAVEAKEYKPLILDLPVNSQDQVGTTPYVVAKGDTLFGIGRKFNSDPELIAALNNIKNPNLIKPGQDILVPRMLQLTHQVSPGDTLWGIATLYGILPQQILLTNDIWFPNKLIRGTSLDIPVAAQVAISNNNLSKISSRDNRSLMYTPTLGVLTSAFGPRSDEFHTGIDLANKTGTPIKAAQMGKVVFVGRRGNYGQTVIIDHQNGFKTLYGHNSKILVKTGQWVQGRQAIALMGSTGRSTGPHLHFEIHEDGKVVNPLKYIYISKTDY